MRYLYAFAFLVLALTACATEVRLPYNDLMRMRPDCSNRDVQIQYLERQLTMMTGNPDIDRQYIAQAKSIIWTLRSTCNPTLTVYR